MNVANAISITKEEGDKLFMANSRSNWFLLAFGIGAMLIGFAIMFTTVVLFAIEADFGGCFDLRALPFFAANRR